MKKYCLRAVLLCCIVFMLAAFLGCDDNPDEDGETYGTIAFDSQGGSDVQAITAVVGTTISRPDNPVREGLNEWEGYEFKGWFTDNGTFNDEYTFSTMPNSNFTLYAKWETVDIWSAVSDENSLRSMQLNGNYYLEQDITLTQNWLPIDRESVEGFSGKLDGRGYKINGLVIEQDNGSGAFILNNSGTIINLHLADVSITVESDEGVASAGGLVDYNNGGTISGCSVTGEISAIGYENVLIGGLVVQNAGIIKDSCANVEIQAQILSNTGLGLIYGAYIGGLVGMVEAEVTTYSDTDRVPRVENCYARGDITVNSLSRSYAGGLAGLNNGNIIASYATGSVTVESDTYAYAGGFVGRNELGTLRNCYAKGNVSAVSERAYAGGFAGENHSLIYYSYATGNAASASSDLESYAGGFVGRAIKPFNKDAALEGCLSAGQVIATSRRDGSHAGGFGGYIEGSVTQRNCYRFTGQIVSAIVDGEPKLDNINSGNTEYTYEEFIQENFFSANLGFGIYTPDQEPVSGTDWENDVWVMAVIDGEFPTLYWQK